MFSNYLNTEYDHDNLFLHVGHNNICGLPRHRVYTAFPHRFRFEGIGVTDPFLV